ncbi:MULTISPECIES: hypothetical protein [unclassified Novosphingobium]|uniref:hypothetical protein n=1 Tax=unclassified Novosphingobium TaxID=2644732 RepID=UPI0014947375|nr:MULTISPECIES: hypothetical protein [unclassified Novosphingobium]MBB3599690.1 hypothetical protein [Novosphingobium sp. BK540]MBB3654045.1 hypothetical protein [Novosphingobium sp. BK626]MBB3359865.1 hypothetical protein [Novosphingobium sp. BK256]MBB3376224.1 hypothetical protein [Novosphingobium sp. BK280]MBB3380638.1 hypothetical protein [Novosphingobium sp. BK258]
MAMLKSAARAPVVDVRYLAQKRPMRRNLDLQMIQIVLHWAWDPIGVRGIENAADEYDMYAPQVLKLLEADAPTDEIATYLTRVVRDRIELPSNPDRDHDVAAMLRQLYAIDR